MVGAGARTGPRSAAAADETSFSRLYARSPPPMSASWGLAWSLDLPDEVTLEGTPLAVGGNALFFGQLTQPSMRSTAASGKLLWKLRSGNLEAQARWQDALLVRRQTAASLTRTARCSWPHSTAELIALDAARPARNCGSRRIDPGRAIVQHQHRRAAGDERQGHHRQRRRRFRRARLRHRVRCQYRQAAVALLHHTGHRQRPEQGQRRDGSSPPKPGARNSSRTRARR